MKLLTILIGLTLGGTATAVWQYLSKWFSDSAFWNSCQGLAQTLIQDPGGDDFFKQYVQLLRALGVYLGKSTCRIGITVLPILIALQFVSPAISKHQAQRATSLVVYPTQNVKLSGPTETLVAHGNKYAWPSSECGGTVSVATPAWSTVVRYEDPIVATNSTLTAMLYQSCGFQVTLHADAPNLLLIRPDARDSNPLWPFLNDLEFGFWTSMILASAAMGMLIHMSSSRNRSRPQFLPQHSSGT